MKKNIIITLLTCGLLLTFFNAQAFCRRQVQVRRHGFVRRVSWVCNGRRPMLRRRIWRRGPGWRFHRLPHRHHMRFLISAR